MSGVELPGATMAVKVPDLGRPPPEPAKPVHTLILDSSPILLKTPPLSALLSTSHALVTTHSVISEITDLDSRSMVDTFYIPFMTVRSPRPESVRSVKEFAQKTGDSAVLSSTDVEVLALAYDLECERNGGDWRLRKVPGQKRVNGGSPFKEGAQGSVMRSIGTTTKPSTEQQVVALTNDLQMAVLETETRQSAQLPRDKEDHPPVHAIAGSDISEQKEGGSSESDSEGWITRSNIRKQQVKDEISTSTAKSKPKVMQVATMTGDFAMQNVLLQMNLNLVSTATCKRITHLKQTILRCHGCFVTTKEMDRQFCPRCGKPTLTRVSCTTDEQGQVKLHLKESMRWNNKGNVFSIPKPASGRSNQKWKGPRGGGGGQRGWGNALILAEDQKEYVRARAAGGKGGKGRDLMDNDYLPNILTGERNKASGKVRIGGGRNVNSKKR